MLFFLFIHFDINIQRARNVGDLLRRIVRRLFNAHIEEAVAEAVRKSVFLIGAVQIRLQAARDDAARAGEQHERINQENHHEQARAQNAALPLPAVSGRLDRQHHKPGNRARAHDEDQHDLPDFEVHRHHHDGFQTHLQIDRRQRVVVSEAQQHAVGYAEGQPQHGDQRRAEHLFAEQHRNRQRHAYDRASIQEQERALVHKPARVHKAAPRQNFQNKRQQKRFADHKQRRRDHRLFAHALPHAIRPFHFFPPFSAAAT